MPARKKAADVEAPVEPSTGKTVTLTSPWGTKVTVAADQADIHKGAGFK